MDAAMEVRDIFAGFVAVFELPDKLAKPATMAPEHLTLGRGDAWAVEAQRRLPGPSDRTHGEGKNPARQRLVRLTELCVNLAAVLFVQEYADAVRLLVERPFAADLHIRRDAKLFRPPLRIEPLALFAGQVPDERSTTQTARVTRPSLAVDDG